MVKNEYLRFLQTVNVEDVQSGVRKMANLICDHLDVIIPLGTAQSRRAKKISQLATRNWGKLLEKLEEVPDITIEVFGIIKQLKSIKIGPFRGFAKEETLDLNSLLVLIYGPNGTGKSSFCEALEYGLLGSVEEAQNKRFNQPDYLKNAHVNRFVSPVIEGVDSGNKTIVVIPNETLYRFCFVEKNRIDNFSRIAAHAPAKQTELISSLFGLEGFNDFTKKFSRELDERHIDLVGKKGEFLIQKQKILEVHKQTIDGNTKSLETQKENEAKLANQYKADTTFEQLVVTLGTKESPGRIQALEAELLQKQSPLTALTVKALEVSKTKVEAVNIKVSEKLSELKKASEMLSFKQLHEAVLDLQEVSKDKCPACKTPIVQVAQNPYEIATAELAKLGYLAQLEKESDQLQVDFFDAIKSVYEMLKVCIEHIGIDEDLNSLKLCLVDSETKLDWSWWKTLEPGSNDIASHWWLLKDQVQKLEKRDAVIKKINEEREPKIARISELRELEKQVIKLQTERKILKDGIQNAAEAIKAFDKENKELIEGAEEEKAVILINKQIAEDYKEFVKMLVAYNEELPRKLVADLGDLVVQMYNKFNRNDAPKDLLAAIRLPLASGQHIEISYQADPSKFFDALHILSEGHIRCLGLAILVAKNLKTNSPLLIFDDPVNAIDDEHRSAIRETLFKDGYFSKKQIILACHGEEFFKNTHQTIGKKAAQRSESYIFSPQLGENHIQVNSLKRPKNYVLAAEDLYKQAEYRDSLMSSRRALENLCEKTWYYYGKYCDNADSLISVSRRNPIAPWDLRLLAENLRSKINKSKGNIPNKTEIVGSFDILLGIGGQDPHWAYLNKGTHEECDIEEFDQAVVGKIVTSLLQLDEALTSKVDPIVKTKTH